MKILLIGAGGVGGAFAAIAARRDFYEQIVIADYDGAKAERAAEATPAATTALRRSVSAMDLGPGKSAWTRRFCSRRKVISLAVVLMGAFLESWGCWCLDKLDHRVVMHRGRTSRA